MSRSGDDRAGSARFWIAALLLSLTTLALRADQIESPAIEPIAGFTPNLADGSQAAAFPPIPPPGSPDDVWTRPQATGDWDGARSELAENGLTFFADITQYYGGVTSGGLVRKFRYGGRGDYLLDIDFQKMGLWEGGRLDLRGETRQGQDCNEIDGAVAPSNFAMALPLLNQNVTALTGVQYTQDLSDSLSVSPICLSWGAARSVVARTIRSASVIIILASAICRS